MIVKQLDPVGVEIVDIDLERASEDEYKFVKNAFIKHQLVLIRGQNYQNPIYYARLVEKISERGITDLSKCNGFADRFVGRVIYDDSERAPDGQKIIKTGIDNSFQKELWPDGAVKQPSLWDTDRPFPVQRVTGERYHNLRPGLFPAGELKWHSDRMSPNHVNSTSLMANRPNGSSTSFIHTPSVYNDFPDEIKQICEQVKCYYRFNPELLAPADERDFTATGLNRHLLLKSQINQNGSLEFTFPLVMTNATNTVKGLYFNFNVLKQLFNTGSYEGDTQLQKFIMSRILRPQYQYTHWWRAGDIMLFSQDLTLHSRRGVTNDQMERRLLFRYGFHV